ncbi:LysR substrate-binding domain-containing protein [Luteibacter sp. UNCMF366Tsu5.1]|uniref:LysR substrate-binding domain-containing protein n=1 Tax=Luteibacter sp. UNCMF366Tsu5.1 TaxID=1502758 RepID=UPI000908897E|nr:LysR substrate-binding domain-containing protein [Luteibacter sp. UNCMF366Tsu5.1]SFW28950.1 DNA-binding transcriptional regulator, LysR family [Luteibacter sp. UNCMF366Tsu5.1]
MFDLRQLRYFVEVAETLSFTQAAQRLHISQPPLSQQIQSLEADLGVRLLDRNRRRVALTEPGRLFLVEAKAILARAESARTVVAEAAAGFTGQLRLAYAVSVSFHPALPETLLRFSHAAPGVSLHLGEMLTGAQYDAILSGQIDVGLLRAHPSGVANARQLNVEVIDREPLVIALPPHHRLAKRDAIRMQDLAEDSFVAPPRIHATTLTDRLALLSNKAGFRPIIRQEAQQIPSLLPLVAAGLGVALVPASLRAVHMSGVTFVPVDDPEAHLLLAVASRVDNSSPVLESFLRTVREAKAKLGLG